jgi:O-methyltransferase
MFFLPSRPMKRLLKNTLRGLGYDLVRYPPAESLQLASVRDMSEEQRKIISTAKPFTMTSVERMAALINAVNYVIQNGIPGDIAECGVWRGGSMMTIALTLLAHGDRSRSLYLFDTFEGMSQPTGDDRSLDGVSADEQLKRARVGTGIWCYAGLEDVRANILSTGYPADKIHLIEGKVEDTIPRYIPPSLSLLRLDTDWYESTKHELRHLYPILDKKGILIVDDYGHWQGAKKAVDEYFAELGGSVYLHRIDYTGRILVRTGT